MAARTRFVLFGMCGIAAVLSACGRDSIINPEESLAPRSPAFSLEPPSASGTLGITSPTDPSARVDLVTYPDPIFVEVRLSGWITLTTNEGGGYYVAGYSGPLYGPGIWIDSVFQSCYVAVMIYHTYGPYVFGPCYRPPSPGGAPEHVDTALFKGAVTISRGGPVPLASWESSGSCGGPCYTYSGSQTYSITPVRFDMALTADKEVIPSPQAVKFQAGSVPFAYEYNAVPFRVTNWEWRAEDGTAGQTVPCSPSSNPCSTVVKESGTMTVTALVNGFEQTKSVKVEVIPCPTGDPILDNEALRNQLMAAMARSNPDSTPESMKRREVGGLIFRSVDDLGVTRYYFKEAPSYKSQTPCLNDWDGFSGNHPDDMAVAVFHTHPNAPGEMVYGCPGKDAAQFPGDPGKKPKQVGDASKTGGGSVEDWNATDGWGYTQYVMTKNGLISRLDLKTPKPKRASNPNMWNWKNSVIGCNWQSSS
jgi:hypothetical protein